MRTHKKNLKSHILIAVAILLVCVPLMPVPAGALCDFCQAAARRMDSSVWEEAEEEFDELIDQEFKNLQRFITHQMWEQSILPLLMLGAEQLTVIAMQQVMAIGMFIDAESQMDAQLLLQEIQARAHKDYHPSVGMCEFGSLMKSIAATERKGEVISVVLSQRSQDRQLGQTDSSGMYGFDLDFEGRIHSFRNNFCNEKDWGNAFEKNKGSVLKYACSSRMDWSDSGFDAEERARINKDIDYFTLFESPDTMKLDFTNNDIEDSSATPPVDNRDELHLFAMASNLFAHETFPRIPARLIENRPERDINEMQMAYMDMRSIVAKRSVAEHSFHAIAAMKAEGNRVEPSGGGPSEPANARLYMEHVLKELGVPDTEILDMLGENPSYHAQMDILTKKLYQNPDFYTNLYDKPANVKRKAAAMQGIKLMQKFDILKSALRSEASMSILLELAVMDLQREIEDQIQSVASGN